MMSAQPGAGGVPPIFIDRHGQPMRFFVDAGGDIDSNTRRTSLRKIQRRGGQIVFNPAEAQYIIVWDDTSDGQLLARNWSNEGKIVLTLEWINLCVREERFVGSSARYGGCRVGVTDGAIQPLVREGAFEEEEELLPEPPPAAQPFMMPPPSSSGAPPASTLLPRRHQTRRLPTVIVPFPSSHTPTGTAQASSTEAISSHAPYTRQIIPVRAASADVLDGRPVPIPNPQGTGASQSIQDFKNIINQLQPQTPVPSFNPLPGVSSKSPDGGARAKSSKSSTAVAGNLLSAWPQNVLDMLAQTLQFPSSSQSGTSSQRASSHPVHASAFQERAPPHAVSASSDDTIGSAASGAHAATLASPVASPGGGATNILLHGPAEHMPATLTETGYPHHDNFVPAFSQPVEEPALLQHGPSPVTPEKTLKRKHGADDHPIETSSGSMKRSRRSNGSAELHHASPSFEQVPLESPAPQMPSSSQASGTGRFFILEEDGKQVQASFWVQPEIKERTKLIRAINRHGGRVAHSMSDCHYVVVRSSLSDIGKSGKNKNAELGWKFERTVVKPTWIEACVAAQELVDIDEYVMEPPVTPKKRGRPKKTTPTPTKVKAEREDSTTTLADVQTTPNRRHVHNEGVSQSSENGWKAEPVLLGDSDDEELF